MENKKKKKVRRFFNRPIKIGLGIASVGASLEVGNVSVYELIQNENLIFWIEIIKYLSIIVGFIFTGSGVIKQAKEDLGSIKIGESVKETTKEIIDLHRKKINTEKEEKEAKDKGIEKALIIAKDLFFKNSKFKY